MTVHSPAGNEQDTQAGEQARADAAANAVADSQDQQDPASQGDRDVAAQSSSATDATEATLQEVIAAAVKPKEDKAEDSGSSDRESGQEPTDKSGKADAQQTQEGEIPNADGKQAEQDDSKLPFHKHPRWQEVLRERDSFKAGHEQFQQIQTFMEVNQLAPQEVAEGFEIMALIRRDPEQALEKLMPFVQKLELVTGRKLPDDLQKRVEDGVADEDTAREAARARFESQRRQALEQSTHETQLRNEQQLQVQQIRSAVAVVEQEIQSGDPDYARKQPFVMDRVRALIVEKQPRTPEEATAIVRQAHAEITDRLKPMVQQRKQVQNPTSGDTATSSRAAPTSLLEVVQQAASQTSR